jgi:glycerol-3-phosphate O-acyltransferase / dihydroxyacetone phosphate acyltransferase
MLYYIARHLGTLGLKVFYKKIYFSGVERIPVGKPMLIASNHPTAFCEPITLACVLRNVEFNFITRGDIFSKPFYRKLLEGLNMIPIFRFRDGYAQMKNNQATMDYVYQALAEKKAILIFPEGTTRTAKRLHPPQKGVARMAFGNYALHGDLDLQIVPVGITYTDAHTFRSEILLEVGTPIPLSRYYNTYKENQNKAVNQLTADIFKETEPLLVVIQKVEDEPLVEHLFELYRNSYPDSSVFPIFKQNKRRLEAEREIANNFYQKLSDTQRVDLKQDVNNYFQSLSDAKVTDFAVAQPYHATLAKTIALVLGFVPYCIGYALHFPIFGYARHIRDTRVSQIEFKAPVAIGVGVGVILVLYLVFLIALMIVNKPIVWAFGLLLPFLGFYTVLYYDFWKRYQASRSVHSIPTATMENWQSKRTELLESVRRPA